MTAMHFEAKKHAYRQTQDGIVVSFVVHPNDMAADLAIAPLGTHYVVALAPYEEKAAEVERQPEPAPVATDAPPKERRPFHTLPRSQQAAIACADPRFRQWLTDVVNRRIGSPPPGHPPHIETASEAAEEVRLRIGIESRRELDTYETAGRGWDSLYRDFRRDTGLEPEERA